MNFKNLFCVSLASITLSACAVPSGSPPLQAQFHGKTKAAIADQLSTLCSSYSFAVDNAADNRVDCSKDGSSLDQFSFGFNHGSTVQYHLSFVLSGSPAKSIMVIPQAYFEAQSALGRVEKIRQDPERNPDVVHIFADLRDWGQH